LGITIIQFNDRLMHRNIKIKTEFYACKMHAAVNQSYDVHPYRYHLRLVVAELERFIHLIPKADRDTVIAGGWAHDLIEDAGVTYHNVLKNTNKIVAEYSYALTNEKGRNRKERASSKYYYEIRIYKHASLIKLCDRIANISYSKNSGSRMFEMYKKEHDDFKRELCDGRWEEAWDYLEKIIK